MGLNIESDSEERARHPEAHVPRLGRAPRRIARVSKDGHKRDRASGHPSRRRFAPPQDEVCGFKLHPPIRLLSWNRWPSGSVICASIRVAFLESPLEHATAFHVKHAQGKRENRNPGVGKPVNHRAGTGATCKQQEKNRLPVKAKSYREPS